MQGVILAGGLGTRLRPMTETIPKPLVPVRSRPFLLYMLEMLKRQGIDKVLLCVGYLWEKIMDQIGDGSALGLRLDYSVEPQPLGTGGALKLAEDKLESEFLLFNGDTYLPMNYEPLLAFWQASRWTADGCIVVYDNTERIAEPNIALDAHNRVTAYSKDSAAGCEYVDAGVQAFKRSVLDEVPRGREVSLERKVYPLLIARETLVAYPTDVRYYDIGTPERIRLFEQYLEAQGRRRGDACG